jgi:membrane dipeptidase
LSVPTRYAGYTSYSYLRPGIDYEAFELAAELDREPAYETALPESGQERAARLMDESVIISLHDHPVIYPLDPAEFHAYNRANRQHTGYAGLARSGMTAVFDNLMDGEGLITSNAGWKWDETVYDLGMRLCDLAHQDYATVGRGVEDILAAHRDGQLAVIFGLEAATPIENEIDRLDILYGLGIRQVGIAYSEANALGCGLKEERDGGLTQFGRRCVERMNRLGLAIDLSHAGDQTSLDTIAASEKPVLITHAGARGVWNSPRMKPDDVVRACAERGGLIGVEAAPHSTLSPHRKVQDLEAVMEHFRYLVDLVGIDHVAFGPDTLFGDHNALQRVFTPRWDRDRQRPMPQPQKEPPYVAGLENPAENFRNITAWLVGQGYSDEDIRKVIGGNVVRVLAQIW